MGIPKKFAGLTLTPSDQRIMKFRDKSIFGRQSTDDLMFYVKRKIDLVEWKVVFAIEKLGICGLF